MRRLAPAQQEAVRMRVMGAIDAGLDDVRAAEIFGVSPKSIGRWKARREAGGAGGLRSNKPGRKEGSGRFLTESEEAALKQAILEFTPEDLGLGGLLWTSKKVHAFIKTHLARKVGYTSEFAFAHAFKREYGLAPGGFRRSIPATIV
jgi:transposase